MPSLGAKMKLAFVIAGLLVVSGCVHHRDDVYTLYRTSLVDPGERVHWATFDSDNSAPYNLNNCLMASRLLNANYQASAKAEGKQPDPGMGFWCEGGGFNERGPIPDNFPAAFPTDA